MKGRKNERKEERKKERKKERMKGRKNERKEERKKERKKEIKRTDRQAQTNKETDEACRLTSDTDLQADTQADTQTHKQTKLPQLPSAILLPQERLVGLVVKASASREEGLRFESRLRWDLSGSSHTSDLKIGTPVAILPGAWSYRVNAGTDQPGVSIL